jgi:hypothetical protein
MTIQLLTEHTLMPKQEPTLELTFPQLNVNAHGTAQLNVHETAQLNVHGTAQLNVHGVAQLNVHGTPQPKAHGTTAAVQPNGPGTEPFTH